MRYSTYKHFYYNCVVSILTYDAGYSHIFSGVLSLGLRLDIVTLVLKVLAGVQPFGEDKAVGCGNYCGVSGACSEPTYNCNKQNIKLATAQFSQTLDPDLSKV